MWKNIAQLDKIHVTIWRMRTECRITKATNKHSDYVIIIAFILEQWLYECAMLRYTFIVCLVFLFTEYSFVVL